jgi:hypothetical protein
MPDEVQPVVLVQVDQYFGIGSGTEPVSTAFEIGAQFQIVEDFAIEDDLDRAVLVADRLGPALDVDDREPCVAESNGAASVQVAAAAVRSARGDRIEHAREIAFPDRDAGLQV